MTISEFIKRLEKVKAEHGDIPVRKLEYGDMEYEDRPYYEDIKDAEFTTDKDEPQTSDNPYADGFVVIE